MVALVEHVLPERAVGERDGEIAEVAVAAEIEAGVEPVLRRQVQLREREPARFRRRLVRVIGERGDVVVHVRVHAQLESLLRRLAEVQIRELRRQAAGDERQEDDGQSGSDPARRRIEGVVPLRQIFREQDVVLRLVDVERGRDQRVLVDDAGVSDFERVDGRFLQMLVADGADRQRKRLAPQARNDGGERRQVNRLRNRHVQEVVHDRRRSVGAVVRHPERLVLLRLDHERRPRREHEAVEVVEPIQAAADDPPEHLGEEDLVLDVGAPFGAAVGERRQRQVELVVSQIAAVGDDVPRLERLHVRRFEIKCLGLEREPDRIAEHVAGQQVVGVAVEDVREERGAESLLAVVDLAVSHHRPVVDVERPDAGFHDALRPRHAARERQLPAVRVIVIDARIELRLGGAGVRKRRVRIRRAAHVGAGARDRAGRARQRVLCIAARGDLVRPAIVHRLRVRAADVKQRARGLVHRVGGSIEAADAERKRGALHLARRLRDHVDDAVQGVGAPHGRRGPANHLDLLDLAEVDRQEVPHHEAEKVLIQAAAVEQRELSGRERARRAAGGDVDVARGHLRDVEPGHGAQQFREMLRRRALERLRSDHGHRGRRVHELLFRSRCGDDDRLLVFRRFFRLLLRFLFRLLPLLLRGRGRRLLRLLRPRGGRRGGHQGGRDRETTHSVHRRCSSGSPPGGPANCLTDGVSWARGYYTIGNPHPGHPSSVIR